MLFRIATRAPFNVRLVEKANDFEKSIVWNEMKMKAPIHAESTIWVK
jgi:hypothetical protein